jgi:hypothetical protein
MHARVLFLLLVATLLSQGCVYSPRVVETTEPGCAAPKKHVEVQATGIRELTDCGGFNSVGCFVLGGGVVGVLSGIVSVTVATTGTAALWVEHKLECI